MKLSIICSNCRSDDIQKRGRHSRNGVPQFYCNSCGRYFRRRYKAKAHRQPTRWQIRRLMLEGKAIRDIAEILDVSPTTVSAHRRRRSGGAAQAMTFAYVDPPYIGQAAKHYSHDPRCAEVDQAFP